MIFLSISAIFLKIFSLPATGHIIINEILFNPREGGVDFIELYNPLPSPVNLQYMYIGRVDKEGKLAQLTPIADKPRSIAAHGFVVLTIDPDIIAKHYPHAARETFISMSKMPAFPNEEGYVVLATILPGRRDAVVIDSLHYTSRMHSPFIQHPKGISLERLSPSRPTNEPGNFRSAAVLVGGATPGRRNSVAEQKMSQIRLQSRIIHPYATHAAQQLLKIDYQFNVVGLMATIRIHDARGRPVKRLVQNSSIPSEGSWIWDGLSDQQQTLPTGIYTIVIELYNETGYSDLFRKSFVLTN